MQTNSVLGNTLCVILAPFLHSSYLPFPLSSLLSFSPSHPPLSLSLLQSLAPSFSDSTLLPHSPLILSPSLSLSPGPCTGRSRVLQWTQVFKSTELAHLVVPVSDECRWTYHKRRQWSLIHLSSSLRMLHGGRKEDCIYIA